MNLSIIGLQYGDEGKGKIIDLISIFSDLNIRYNGGHNAGHIIYIRNIKKKIRILPSAIFKKNCLCFISEDVMFSLENFCNEIFNVNFDNIIISNNLIILNKFDEILDYLFDLILKIGTTNSGISIAFLRKQIKCCFKLKDFQKIFFLKLIKKNVFLYNIFFFYFKIKIKINIFNFYNFLKKNFNYIKNIIVDNVFINKRVNKLFESSQGVLLDINKGSFPFVTCSNIINKSIYINNSFYSKKIKFICIIKSYFTRIGNGFFISKIKKKKNKIYSILTNEFGSNSYRIRSIGWIDVISITEMIKTNNISNIILTRMDSFIFLKYIKILLNYKLKNNIFFDYKYSNVYNCEYVIIKSWKKTKNNYILNEKNFHFYIKFFESIFNTPIKIISIGKQKNDVIIL